MRLFTAVYPSAAASAHLDLALGGVGGAAVADPGAGLRWVPKEQRHVTLAFHGEVPDGAVPGYVDALTAALAGTRAFELELAGGGSFGGRTLWVGVTGALDALRSLAALVEEAAADAGLPADDRAGGRPHLTVARASASRAGRAGRTGERGSRRPRGRSDDAASPLAHWARALAVYRGPAWPVEAVHVVASELGAGRSGGPLHDDVAVVRLAR
ncbi:RNA 2',3'-cyclic phosphodiesterase [Isoptericola variabilis]|uniref:RNA 2',3'-cyclic phosphodiesterase n=1 Tax=Isoptericola variabilis (strain 225) TaxID=743718 RepID=F6FT26_ISOV2|nr:RNA 2',3'-cyclic phosphodiesterase [Isoptericola variabilis]AEG44097.1 2'-5' RNA ligase [Isoptericola variabilis 225]TWH28786.1 2'-5' RNA ligase [Isoptericola variabilis J7]